MSEPAFEAKSEEELQSELEKCPAERVTEDYIQGRIAGRPQFIKATETLTICIINIDNGFTVTGESACVKPENYNQEIGENIAYKNAFAKLWGFFGFLLAENGSLKKAA